MPIETGVAMKAEVAKQPPLSERIMALEGKLVQVEDRLAAAEKRFVSLYESIYG